MHVRRLFDWVIMSIATKQHVDHWRSQSPNITPFAAAHPYIIFGKFPSSSTAYFIARTIRVISNA